jgi:hypothetical protein
MLGDDGDEDGEAQMLRAVRASEATDVLAPRTCSHVLTPTPPAPALVCLPRRHCPASVSVGVWRVWGLCFKGCCCWRCRRSRSDTH